MWERIASAIRDNDHFLLTSHVRPDGDAICSTLALHLMLKNIGKTSRWALSNPPSPEFSFLYDSQELEQLGKSTPLDDVGVVCALDIPDWNRLGEAGERVERLSATKICLDHHPRSGPLVDLEVRDTQASATAALIYRLLRHMGLSLTLPVAKAIYTGILTDTMCFHLANTNEEAHEIAAACVRVGVDPAEIYESVYGTVSLARLRLTGEVLSTLGLSDDGRVAYLYATRDMYDRAGAKRGDDEDLVEYARSLGGVHIALFLRELDNGRIRISWRAREDVDVSALARQFGGGGHVRASGADAPGPLNNVLKDVLASAIARVSEADSPSA